MIASDEADGRLRVTAHPNLNFTVVINPENGPGDSSYPGDDYAPQIQSLNAYSNVRTVGYVRTDYASRNISSVIDDVATYSSWSTNRTANTNTSAPLAVHGIFFDEAPYDYSPTIAKYMETINQAAKNMSGLLADRIVSLDKYYRPIIIGRRVALPTLASSPPLGLIHPAV